MEADRVRALRDVLHHTEWWSRAAAVGRTIRRTPGPGHLLLVGTPAVEPWHLAAHLDDEARLSGLSQLAPQLVRWNPPAGAPPHLAIGMQRLEQVARGETVFVVSPQTPPEGLLERVDDARRTGATVVALDDGGSALGGLAHERMSVSSTGLVLPEALAASASPLELPPEVLAGAVLPASFELAQHFISAASGEPEPQRGPGWRQRLSRVLETISGPPPHSTGQRR
ncbi:hypothetical protein [Angustibacter aerolatus]